MSSHRLALVRPIVLGLALSAGTLTACKERSREVYTPGSAKAVLGIDMAQVKSAVAARLDSGASPSWVPADRWKRVKGLYGRFGNAPLWLEADGVRDRASALLAAIKEAPAHALATDAYPLDSIQRVVDADNLAKSASAQALADADVLLTAAYVAYASDMLAGQVDPKTVSQAWHIPASRTELDSALVRSLQSPSMQQGLAAMQPQDSSYAVLKEAYARYRQIDSAGGWPVIPSGPPLRPGAAANGARVDALRRRLAAEGLLQAAAGGAAQAGTPIGPSAPPQQPSPTKGASTSSQRGSGGAVYDADLAAAVKQFQERHGLAPTGVLSEGTTKALNVPAAERVQQIASNLERYRWLPRSLGSRYILVNVPAFHLEAYDGGKEVLQMKVVVGAEYQGRATPVFSDSMEFVVFRPYWNVTDEIAANEIMPKIAADPGYLDRNRYEFFQSEGKRRVRQKPGEKNALGLVKFMFPNSFNIYLHDTPEKSLFAKSDRAASHGCIRLEHPDQLAQFVLGWPADRVRQAMESGGDNRTVSLPNKIPVYIVYFTAYGHGGALYFSDDLYGRDEALEEEIADSAATRPDTARR